MHIGRYWRYLYVQALVVCFVSNDSPISEAFLQKSIFSFITRLSSSSNKLICGIGHSWIMKKLIRKTWEE